MKKLFIATCLVIVPIVCSDPTSPKAMSDSCVSAEALREGWIEGCEQSFIKPKTKKNCPSKQQYAELKGELVDSANRLLAVLADLQKRAVTLQREALDTVTDYLDGEKDCFLQQADKAARTTQYQEDLKKKQAIERLISTIEAAVF